MSEGEEVRELMDFELMIETTLENFVIACKPLDNLLLTTAYQVKDAFLATKALIVYGLTHPEPTRDHPLMVDYSEAIRVVVDARPPPKDSPFANHLATCREAIIALGFMTVKPAPTQFVRDMLDASLFYSNRVLSQHKGIEKHMLFVTKVNELFTDLFDYVKKHHLTGFAWNSRQSPIKGLPAPPPPPPPPAFSDPLECGDNARVALLNALNQGSGITRNLKPVKRDETTKEVVHGGQSAASGCGDYVAKPAAKKTYPPKFILDGKKWLLEHQKDNFGLEVNNESMSESVACYKVENCAISVANKVNNVVIDSCSKTAVTLQSVISSVELIRCDRVQIKCNGMVPLINLDNCESVQIFLSRKSRMAEMISSKSSSCNVCLLEDDGNYKELPMQEQIKTVLEGEKLISTVIEKN